MSEIRLGIIMQGVIGRMGMNQQLIRSFVAIRQQGSVLLSNGDRVMPDPFLLGRNAKALSTLAQSQGIARWGTDLKSALANPARYHILRCSDYAGTTGSADRSYACRANISIARNR